MISFRQLCRNLGLMIHHVSHPPVDEPVIRRTTKRQVNETAAAPNLVLRRTTIEEVEFRPPTSASESR